MKVLVTGATGLVGRAIVRHLAGAGLAVRAAARRPEAIEPLPGVEPVPLGDLAGTVDWTALVAGTTAAVHAAGLAHDRGIDEATLMGVNAGAPAGLAAAMAAAGLDRLVLVSSVRAATGPASAVPVGPGTLPRPGDAYGRSKRAGETAVLAALPAVRIVRPPAVHGAGARGGLASLARLARSPLPLPLAGLAGRRSVVSDANLAGAAAFLITADALAGTAQTVTDGAPLTVPRMVAAMRQALGRPAGLFSLPAGAERRILRALAPGLADRLDADLVVDDTPLRAAGWLPAETSADGLARLVRAQARL